MTIRSIFKAFCWLLVTPLFAITVFAQPTLKVQSAVAEKLSAQIEKKLKSTPSSIQKAPIAGLYEVVINGDVLYVDADVKYLIRGDIFDTSAQRNLTQARSEELSRIDFKSLPLQHAIKSVNGNGKQVVAVFEDPNCGYCKRFRQTLTEVDDLTIYTFQYNILSDRSQKISRQIWCSSDPAKNWDNWMLKNDLPAEASAGCKDPHREVLALGQSLKINGTPTFYFANGKKMSGAISADDFKFLLKANAS